MTTDNDDGKPSHRSGKRAERPVAGDWVALKFKPGERRCVLHAVIPLCTVLSRQPAARKCTRDES